MKISLIVPIYNAEKDLPDLFESIEHQTRNFDEIILVDNNSKDISPNLCKNFQEKNHHLNISVLEENTPGPGPARNKGILAASGDIICFTDADCVLEKDFTKNTENFFLQNGQADIFGGTALKENPVRPSPPQNLVEEFSTLFWSGERASDSSYPLNKKEDLFSTVPSYITTFNMACRKKVLDKLKGFEDIKTMEDIDFWLRACDAGFHSVGGIPQIRVFHKNRSSLKALYRQYYHYMHSLPWLLKRHFHRKFIFAWQMKKIFSFSLFTGYFEFNPHTLLLFVILIKISFFPYALLLLIAYKYLIMARKLFYTEKQNSLLKALFFAFFMEVRKIAMTAGAIMGSIKYKILCIL